MIRTRVGYAGGSTDNPTYYDLADHTETLQIDFDPSVISYAELLDIFWSSHTPTSQSSSRQYQNMVFYDGEDQERAALDSRDRLAERLEREIRTIIRPLEGFYRAEGYHQKYYLRNDRVLLAEMQSIYPDLKDFTDSTAVARVNGYVGGYGNQSELDQEIDLLGLTEAGQERLRSVVRRR